MESGVLATCSCTAFHAAVEDTSLARALLISGRSEHETNPAHIQSLHGREAKADCMHSGEMRVLGRLRLTAGGGRWFAKGMLTGSAFAFLHHHTKCSATTKNPRNRNCAKLSSFYALEFSRTSRPEWPGKHAQDSVVSIGAAIVVLEARVLILTLTVPPKFVVVLVFAVVSLSTRRLWLREGIHTRTHV